MINVRAHTFISRYTPNKKYSHAPSKRRFLQFLSLKTIKGNLETGPCLFVRNEGSGQVRDGYKQVRPERQQQSELLIRSVHRAATTLEPARAATGAAGGGPQCFVGFVEL